MGNGLLFSDVGDCRDSAMYFGNEKRRTLNYGNTTLPAPVTHPSPTVARSRSRSPPPVLDMSIIDRPNSQLLIDFAPLTPGFPRSPSPTLSIPRRSSQDSVTSGTSIASSGVMSPSLLSWPMPPSTAPSVKATPPSTSHGPRFSLMPSLVDLSLKVPSLQPQLGGSSGTPGLQSNGGGQGQFKFSTGTSTAASSSRPGQGVQVVMPSNWVKPNEWS